MQHRSEIVRLHESEKLTERQIAKLLDLSHSTVHYWLSKVDSPPGARGRPRITSPTDEQALRDRVIQDPFVTATALREESFPNLSVDTIRRRLREQGFKCRIPARKPYLKPHHIAKRRIFAINHEGWSVDMWRRVVFSDEKVFRSSTRGPLRVYRPTRSDRYDARFMVPSSNPSGRHTVCVWVAFGHNFRLIHRITRKTLNAEYYTQSILSAIETHLRENELIFMHDQSPIHTSRLTKQWLEERNIEVMEDWPPKGPDMNPVENVWAELVRRIRDVSTNQEQLWENVVNAFNNLEDEYFEKLIQSMPRRIQAVKEKEGGWTKY